jgi:hypothetical protein
MDPATIVRVIRIVTGKPCRENIAPEVAAQDEHVGPDRGRQIRPERLRMSGRASSPGRGKGHQQKSRDLTLAQLHGSARPAPGQSRPSPISRPGSLGSRQDETGEARQLPSETSPCGRFWRRGRLPKHQRQPSAAKCGPALVTGTKEQPCFDIAETVRLQPPDREQLRPK